MHVHRYQRVLLVFWHCRFALVGIRKRQHREVEGADDGGRTNVVWALCQQGVSRECRDQQFPQRTRAGFQLYPMTIFAPSLSLYSRTKCGRTGGCWSPGVNAVSGFGGPGIWRSCPAAFCGGRTVFTPLIPMRNYTTSQSVDSFPNSIQFA